MELSGSFTVDAPRNQVYDFITDPDSLILALPDIKGYTVHDTENFTLSARVGVKHVHGTMKVKMRVVEKDFGDTVTFSSRANGIGSNVDLKTTFRLNDAPDGGTAVNWASNAQIVGRLASLAGGLLQPLARKNINIFMENIRRALEPSGQPNQRADGRERTE
jgi:carbon monoxide dehydrogenase subunit G